ncbi:hypothetical protein CspeluHIS016_0101200 [Cutaneotrichosporon spelunceum]|uniref:Uncharacterized protein n=1 Tax=Cutaneotrichosporon spelunceum TaxID=1672016 RepID=A0AAD3TN35_9TREE|nr:hypothetical protein CspeluHIS016_0101200 [Cutaneotrichosporon spelunceum]
MPPHSHLSPAALAARSARLVERRAALRRTSPNRLTRHTQAFRDATNRLDDILQVLERLLHILEVRGLGHPYQPLWTCYEDALMHGERARCFGFGQQTWNQCAIEGYQGFVAIVELELALQSGSWGWYGARGRELWEEIRDAAQAVVSTIRVASATAVAMQSRARPRGA